MIFKRNRLTPRMGMIYCDVYDYIVREAKKRHQDLIIQVDKEVMTIPYKQLKNYELLTDQIFISKFGGQNYKLYSYKWKPDKPMTAEQEYKYYLV